ncbi:hypothetical protein [Hasllibacter halocynthiae]|uniref:hypothetical protein n=1 Tax=Hasllibacter halocynthiae TaxID=595589 RepID=UPI0011B1C9E5|nr:hypothetical protein [Hasllibacter halocynthiae]
MLVRYAIAILIGVTAAGYGWSYPQALSDLTEHIVAALSVVSAGSLAVFAIIASRSTTITNDKLGTRDRIEAGLRREKELLSKQQQIYFGLLLIGIIASLTLSATVSVIAVDSYFARTIGAVSGFLIGVSFGIGFSIPVLISELINTTRELR